MSHWPAAFGFSLASVCCAAAADFIADIDVNPIHEFKIGSGDTRFGPLTFVGGFTMTSTSRDFGALSSFRFLDDKGERFAAVADTGHFITGAMKRDEAGVPVSVAPLGFTVLPGMDGRVSSAKWETDSESLLVDEGSVIIGFERRHRIVRFAFDGDHLGAPIARAPENGSLQGAVVAISEKSIDPAGNIFAAVLSGPMKGVFTITRSDDYDITDGDFLPGGDLVILERSYQMARGVRMRLKRVAADAIRPGAVVEGDILLEADMAFQIDNMEGLDIWRAPDGTTRLSLVSDDNKSILQRNIYLEFMFSE
jgi:hypothetical protein